MLEIAVCDPRSYATAAYENDLFPALWKALSFEIETMKLHINRAGCMFSLICVPRAYVDEEITVWIRLHQLIGCTGINILDDRLDKEIAHRREVKKEECRTERKDGS